MLVISRQYEAFLDTFHMITLILPYSYHGGQSSRFTLVKDGNEIPLELKERIPLDDAMKYTVSLADELELGRTYTIKDEHNTETDLQIGAVIRTDEFDRQFYYDGDDLGLTFEEDRAVFKVWSPTATEVKVKLKAPQEEDAVQLAMERSINGVWELTIRENIEGWHYTFLTCINLIWSELVDPYAKSVSFNSEWGCAVDPEKITPRCSSLQPLPSPVDSVIYELNVRDFSSAKESGMKFKGKYLAFTEKETGTPSGLSSGISYLKELGVTHVELLPVNDFDGVSDDPADNRYNWGYNPLYFNAPEGSYSMNPADPAGRIRELKSAIHSLHEENIRVILDVVYNHVFVKETSSFEKLVPGYFFRHDENGLPSNGTGVGNDFASERLMARKFIKDSIRYWLKTYGVDGFRFDLMGILDVTTMNEIRDEVDEILPGAILIGEGWDLNTPIAPDRKANLRNANSLKGIGQFNDCFRDTIKGSTFNLHDKGFALGHGNLEAKVELVLTGSIGVTDGDKGIFNEPAQSVNYVESHDNHTLWDKMKACLEEEDELLMKRQKLATSMVLLSQGIPFLHAGQEFFRTKQGVENSYNSPVEINRIDWLRRERHEEDIEYIRGLIAIRKSHGAFRFRQSDLIRKHAFVHHPEEKLVTVHYRDVHPYGPWNELLLIFHSGESSNVRFPLPKGKSWTMLSDGKKANVNGLRELDGDSIGLEGICSYVIVR